MDREGTSGMINAQKMRSEMELSHKIIDALCYSYQGVYYANTTTGQVRCYRMARAVRDKFGSQFGNGDYETHFYNFVRNVIYYEDQKLFEPILTIAGLRKIFSRQMSYSFSYRMLIDNEIHYGQVEALRVLDSKDEIVLAFKSMDKQHQLMVNEYEKEQHRIQEIISHLKNVALTPLESIISEGKNVKLGLESQDTAIESIDKIIRDSQFLLKFLQVIVSDKNDNREKLEEAIMRFKYLEK